MSRREKSEWTTDERILEQLMSDISEDHWAAGWNHNVEHYIWRRRHTDEQAIVDVVDLAERIGRWIVWDRDPREFEQCSVSLDEWREMHEMYLRRYYPGEAAS